MRGALAPLRRGQAALALLIAIALPALAADISAIRELIRTGRFTEAAAACDRDLRAAPGNPALLTLKGLALRGAGDRTGSLAAFRAAGPRYLPALQAAAQIEYEAKDPRARQTLESIVQLDPANPTAHAMLADLAFTAGDCPRALAHLPKSPASPLSRWRTGVCLFQTERWREAAAEFAALLKVREHAPTRFNLALSLWRAGDPAATLAALQPLPSPDADALSLQAAALRARGDVPGALALLQRGVADYPRDERLLVELAALCLDQNAVELGIRVLEAGVGAMPQSARLLTALGVLHVRAGQAERAQSTFEQAARFAPESGLGQTGVAMLMLQMGLAAEAAAHLRALPAEAPLVRLTLARALSQMNPPDNAAAIKTLRELLARDPKQAAAHGLLGKLLAQTNQPAAAIAELEQALALDPQDRASAHQLLLLYRRAGRPTDAARAARLVRDSLVREKSAEAAAERYRLSEQ
ncbi:MAG: tetratricopeptide repeat protein [Bryobacterales bacterium]|nr:tetratricopeptide repeat protein [Bryobacterales bacterium]